ncbi:MAG: hypothetical protein IJ716_14460 [Lachnospiraceae bacterium]|nr:hypothetical protein [Lachnospiraceae bacterium]
MTKHKTLVLDYALSDRVDKYCKAHNLKFSQFVSRAISVRLDKLENEERYVALELEHLGDPDKKTGIYAERGRKR